MLRALLISAAALAAPVAMAQTALPERPQDPAPAATDSADARQNWCEHYTAWFIASTPPTAEAANAVTPADVSADHEQQVEFNSCTVDPREYERQTHAEAELQAEEQAG